MGGGGGLEELIIKLISAEAEAEALLVLAELGNNTFKLNNWTNEQLINAGYFV